MQKHEGGTRHIYERLEREQWVKPEIDIPQVLPCNQLSVIRVWAAERNDVDYIAKLNESSDLNCQKHF